MKIGIIGLQGSGKTTVFETLIRESGRELKYGSYGEERLKPHLGTIFVSDERLSELARVTRPKKTTPCEMIFIDRPGFDMVHAKEVDGLMVIVGLFMGRDGVKDINDVEAEMILSDLGAVQTRLKKLEKEFKAKELKDEAEYEAVLKCSKALEDGRVLRNMAWTEHEMVILHGFQFLTLKPIVAVLNIAESELGREAPRDIAELLGNKKVGFVAFSAKIELEIMDLSAEERPEFLKSLGIESCARDKLVKACFKMLDLVTFYTIKGDEARAWPVKVGTKALDAAGKIHSDIKKGFIRAEVVNYKEFVESGSSFHEARAKGHFRLEGRDYPVKDGDIIDFRFSV